MSNIPKARALLQDAIDGKLAWESAVRLALPLMTRAPMAKRRAPTTSAFVDAQMAAEIRKACTDCPDLSIVELAELFSTNPGRVSEAIHGLR